LCLCSGRLWAGVFDFVFDFVAASFSWAPLTLLLILHSCHRPSPGRAPVHTQPFAFHAPQEHDESVKMSNPTRSRASALVAVTGTVIVSPAPLLHAGRRISPALFRNVCHPKRQFLFNTNEPLTDFATRTKQTTSFFPSDATKRLSRASNSAIHTKQITSLQITSLFLFNTNERSRITSHRSLITSHQS
jgi:hypothetical protein